MTHKFIRVNNIADKKYIQLTGSNKAFPKSHRPSKKTQELGMGNLASSHWPGEWKSLVTALWCLLNFKIRPYAEESTHFRHRCWSNWIASDLEAPYLRSGSHNDQGCYANSKGEKAINGLNPAIKNNNGQNDKMSIRVHSSTFILVVSHLLGLKTHYKRSTINLVSTQSWWVIYPKINHTTTTDQYNF